MKLRRHRGNLTVVEIEPTMHALVAEIRKSFQFWELERVVTPEQVHVEPYGPDPRTGWDTYIVTVDGLGVFGFTDGAPAANLHSAEADAEFEEVLLGLLNRGKGENPRLQIAASLALLHEAITDLLKDVPEPDAWGVLPDVQTISMPKLQALKQAFGLGEEAGPC